MGGGAEGSPRLTDLPSGPGRGQEGTKQPAELRACGPVYADGAFKLCGMSVKLGKRNPRMTPTRFNAAKSMRIGLLGIVIGCGAVVVSVVLLSDGLLTGRLGTPPPATVTGQEQLHQLDQLGPYLSAVQASVDQLVSMLTTVQLSLFVLAGVALGKVFSGDRRLSTAETVISALFLIFALASFTLGYAARMQMAELIELATASFASARATVVHQAMFVTLVRCRCGMHVGHPGC